MRYLPLFISAFLISLPSPSSSYDSPPPRSLLPYGHPPSMAATAEGALPARRPPKHLIPTHAFHTPGIIRATSQVSSAPCKPTYGVLPCTRSIIGGIFLLAIYGYIIFRAARFLAQGSELLLLVLRPSIVGGLLLPIFGVLPDSILVLVTGLGGDKAEAQEEIIVGIGLIAGSNIMLLTLLWGVCLIIGRWDLKSNDGMTDAANKRVTKGFHLLDTGVEIDKQTRVSAAIMCASIIPILVAQVSHIFHVSSTNKVAVLLACIISIGGLLVYCCYQGMAPSILRRKKLKALHNLITYGILKFNPEVENLLGEGGKVNEEVLKRIFQRLDTDKDGSLTRDEVRVMLVVASFKEKVNENVVEYFMDHFDKNKSNTISLQEFLEGMNKWCSTMKSPHTDYRFSDLERLFKMEKYLEDIEDLLESGKNGGTPRKPQLLRKSLILLLLGVAIVAAFAEPLVDAVTNFSHASHIPSFFASFVLLPIASNASEAISSIIFSSRRKKKNISLTYSQIYGAVTMNNTMSLGILLAIIYARHLEWNFSSEVLIICIVTLIMGVIGLSRKILPLWISILALLLYPLAIAAVAIFDYIIGWK